MRQGARQVIQQAIEAELAELLERANVKTFSEYYPRSAWRGSNIATDTKRGVSTTQARL